MADPEHVRKLLEDVAAWNQWRSENPNVQIDLREADLRDAELPGANLREANLGHSNLRDAVLDNADLSSADLQYANMIGARLREADLRKVYFDRARLDSVDAVSANFGEADLSNSQFRGAKLVGANLSKAICKDATFVEAKLTQSDLTRTDFRDSNFTKTDFVEASLQGADLRRCVLNGASFRSADLSNANLRLADLNNADLANAKLIRANLRNVTGLICNQLTQAQDWQTAYRDEALACGAAIPDPKKGVVIEVPLARIGITDHPPTITVTGKPVEAHPVTAAKSASIPTAEEIDEATRHRFDEMPTTVIAEAKRAKETTIALQTFLRDLRLNIPEADQAQELLEKQADALDNIVAMLQSDGDKEAARNTLRDQLYDVLESFLEVLADQGVTRGILAAAAIALLSLTGVDVGHVIGALVAGSIIGIDAEALKNILHGWKKKKDKGE